MSSEIFYERVFIKMPGNRYIPLLLTGSDNCYDSDMRRTRSWQEFRPHSAIERGEYILTEEQVRELAKEAKDWPYYGMYRGCKSAHNELSAKQAEQYILNGMKYAITPEIIARLGNSMEAHLVFPHSTLVGATQLLGFIKTTRQLLEVYSQYDPSLIRLQFLTREKFHWPQRTTPVRELAMSQGFGYVVVSDGLYVIMARKTSKGRRVYLSKPHIDRTQFFATLQQVRRFVKTNQLGEGFEIQKVLLPQLSPMVDGLAA